MNSNFTVLYVNIFMLFHNVCLFLHQSHWETELRHALISPPRGDGVHGALNSSKQLRTVNLSVWMGLAVSLYL